MADSAQAKSAAATAPTPSKDAKSSEAKGTSKENSKSQIINPFSREAFKALAGGIPDAIVDIRVSSNEQQDSDLSRNGYEQLLQEGVRKTNTNAISTFGNKSSIWVWRRSQGTCSGRLKPIVDIIFDSSSLSSDLVLTGYTCDPVTIAGYSLWIKRASTEEEEKDAIVDLYVTTGKMKDTSDPIWTTPGVGWVRVDGNFTRGFFSSIDTFLWYRPARTRSMEAQLSNPVKAAVALTDEIRQTKLLAAVRISLRHYVPVNDVKRLSTLVLDSTQVALSSTSTSMIRSDRMLDFCSLFHMYAPKGKMNQSNWTKLLYDTGCKMKANDVSQMFRFFDHNQNGSISIEEYTQILILSDYELDLALEKIRIKLLLPSIPRDILRATSNNKPLLSNQKANIGVIGAQSIQLHPYIGKNKIRENIMLSNIFSMVNLKKDAILSLDDMMDLSSKMEVFLTEEEARKALSLMDLNGDDRVEEADFICFMRKESVSVVRKAYRLREGVAMLRRWLVRGTTSKLDQSSLTATASKEQWRSFKTVYKKVFLTKFPGYLSPQLLQIALRNLGIFLSTIEAREFTLMVAPEKSGRVHLTDLHAFMGRNCRSFGELVAMLEREILVDLVDAYRAQYKAKFVQGKEDLDLTTLYQRKLDELRRSIENVYLNSSKSNANGTDANATVNGVAMQDLVDEEDEDYNGGRMMNSTMMVNNSLSTAEAQEQQRLLRMKSHDIISVTQVRAGLWDYYVKRTLGNNPAASSTSANTIAEAISPKISEAIFPNAEEFSALSILVDTDIAEGDIYGLRLKGFLEGICHHIVTSNQETFEQSIGDPMKVEIISRELQLQIFREAKQLSAQNKALSSKQQQLPDYLGVFQLFDENKNGLISLSEFKNMLKKFQLVSSLPDHLMATLLAKFDKTKKGNITFDDFKAFAEEAKNFVNEEDAKFIAAATASAGGAATAAPAASAATSTKLTEDDMDIEKLTEEDLVDNDDISKISDLAPVAITKNKDADWLLWFLYRQACKISPKDPESVITDLESLCYELYMRNKRSRAGSLTSASGVPIITIRDLWNLLFEVNLQGNLVKTQFYTGIEFLSTESSTVAGMNDDRTVDYAGFCKYIVRMGRGYLTFIQDRQIELQKKYQTIFPEIKKYFKQLCDEIPADKKEEMPRFIKIFRRLDRDHDGMITPLEFKLGLKRLHFKDFKLWTLTMIKYLFHACDKNDDGLLSITEFMEFILDKNPTALTKEQAQMVTGSVKLSVSNPDKLLHHSDSEDEAEYLQRKTTSTDFQLMQKVNEVLMDVVPSEAAANMSQAKHIETVRSSVRRFFVRADTDGKGVVSEDRFKEFLRRSGLRDKLTAAESRRLTDKLRKRGKGNEELIDYEKLCQQLLAGAESVPRSKAEMIFTRLQDAAIASAASGRSFLNLCSLVDLHFTGRITKDELLHISKMMDCPMSLSEFDMMSELFQEDSRILDRKSQTIDYQALHNFLQAYSVRNNLLLMNNTVRSLDPVPVNTHYGALPAYATPGVSFLPQWDVSGQGINRTSINTPLGYPVTTPQKFGGVNQSFALQPQPPGTPIPYLFPPGQTPGGSFGGVGGGAAEKILRSLIERIRQAVQDRSATWGASISLRKRFESQDIQNVGYVSTRLLQQILEELSILMTTSELHVLYASYGKAEDDRFFYDSFCRAVDTTPVLERIPNNNNSSLIPSTSNNNQAMSLSSSFGGTSALQPAYLTSRVLQRYKELKQEGYHLMDIFQAYDNDRNFMVLANKFKDVITRTQLLTTEHQLMKAMEDFSAIGNKSYINYEDFCEALEKALVASTNNNNNGNNGVSGDFNATQALRASLRRSGGGGVGGGIVDSTNGYDGFRTSYNHDIPNSGRDDPNELYESLHRMRMPSSQRGGGGGDGSDYVGQHTSRSSSNHDFYDYALSPPKPSDSISMFPPSSNHHHNQISARRSAPSSPLTKRPSSPILAPRTSPSRVGTKMWGHDTPITQKGRTPRVDSDKWCCGVCLYVENPNSAMNCLVCDSPNYSARKDYQIKEQCRNCTFLNGHFAEECEMCGEPLSHGTTSKTTSSNQNQSRRDFDSPFPSGRKYTTSSSARY